MDLNLRKEQFSHAYIRAVAAVAGLTIYRPEVDDDSVDLGLAARGGGGLYRSPRLEIQTKCTGLSAGNGASLAFPLKKKNYDDLRADKVHVPRILLVVLVPDSLNDWLLQSEAEMAMRRCGYWTSLRGSPDVSNEATITVRLPRGQIFSVEALNSMMERIGAGGMP